MKRVLRSLAVLAVLSMAAAQPFVWPNAWTAAEPGEAQYGGTYTIAELSDPRTFNQFVSAEVDIINLGMHEGYSTLVYLGPSSTEYVPYMAESYEVSDDGLVVTVDVRQDMKWSDGDDLTAEDFYFTYLAQTDPDVGDQAYDGWFVGDAQIELELVDEYTLRFTFPQADRLAFPIVAMTPAPDHILGEIYREGGAEALRAAWGTETDLADTVWSGPFVPVQFVPGQRIVFERNPYYGEWNVDEQGNALPYLDRIVATIVESTDAELNLYLAGEIDSMTPENLDQVGVISQAVNNGDIDAVLLPNVAPVASSQFFVFNWNKESDPFKQALFRNVKFRRAVSHLTDREAMVDLVYGSAATPAWSNVYQLDEFWYNPDVPKYAYDPERALELLAEIGFTSRNRDGVLVDADGNELSFSMATNAGNSQREQIMQIFADSAREIGMDVELQALDFNLLVDQLLASGDDRPFDSILIGLSGSSIDWPFGTNTITCDGGLHAWNLSGACLTAQETLIEELNFQGRGTLDNDAAQQIAYRIQEVWADLQPFTYTVSPLSHYTWLSDVRGQHPDGLLNGRLGTRQLPLTFKAQ